MIYDPQEISRRDAYNLAISIVIPRPIAFVTSLNKQGVVNAAPFSYFNGVCSKPALISISIADKKGGVLKDTLNNIKSSQTFCVNLVSQDMAAGVQKSAEPFAPDVSEMDFNGFNLLDCEKIKAPRIKESPASMECKLVRIVDDLGPISLVIGQVLLYHISDECVSEKGLLDPEKSNVIGRLGGPDFSTLGEVFSANLP